MRAIQRWRAAAPGRDLTIPDHADLCVWLLEQVERGSLTDPKPGRDHRLEWNGTEWVAPCGCRYHHPLDAALNGAGYEGAGYEIASKNLGTLIEQRDAAKAREAELRAALTSLEGWFADALGEAECGPAVHDFHRAHAWCTAALAAKEPT